MQYHSLAVVHVVLYIPATELNWKWERREPSSQLLSIFYFIIRDTECARVLLFAYDIVCVVYARMYIWTVCIVVVCVNPILFSNTFISFAMKLFVYHCVLDTPNHKNFTTPPLQYAYICIRCNGNQKTIFHPMVVHSFHAVHPLAHLTARLTASLTHLNLYMSTKLDLQFICKCAMHACTVLSLHFSLFLHSCHLQVSSETLKIVARRMRESERASNASVGEREGRAERFIAFTLLCAWY